MNLDPHEHSSGLPASPAATVKALPAPSEEESSHDAPRHRIGLPILLFLITCYTTFDAHAGGRTIDYAAGLTYSAAIMLILLCHELGHYLQARRYHVSASLPYFIPMPTGPLGTMGAVINMSGGMGDRKSLFDIGISGPLAGLVPTIICCIVGLKLSTVTEVLPTQAGMLGEPLIFQFLQVWVLPEAKDKMVWLHPLGYAGWVGVFLTAVNLFPIGQLDGGHVLYAMLRKKAWPVAMLALSGAMVGVVFSGRYEWSLMLALLLIMGPYHPPTADDSVPLGLPRIILGWVTLAFVIIGFTPKPF